jgi:hypothetical protein
MRRAAPLVVLAVALGCAPLAVAKPVALNPKWHRVLTAPRSNTTIAANDRYVAMAPTIFFPGQPVTLADDLIRKHTTLYPPACTGTSSESQSFSGGLFFGGPWLMVGCDLYNLDSGQWTPFQLSPKCSGTCVAVGVGRYWVKIESSNFSPDYRQYAFYLQNVSTGQLVGDPASPGGSVYDDLNAPSGSTPLCPPLRYPARTIDSGGGQAIEALDFYGSGPGRFAINPDTYRLYRCHSGLNVSLPGPVASSSAVNMGAGLALLPGLQRFTVSGPGAVAAVTRRSMYATTSGNRLYSAPIPTARQVRACRRYQHKRRHRSRVSPCRYS